jgi:hypothetical protein
LLHFREPAEVFSFANRPGRAALRAIEARIARGRLYPPGSWPMRPRRRSIRLAGARMKADFRCLLRRVRLAGTGRATRPTGPAASHAREMGIRRRAGPPRASHRANQGVIAEGRTYQVNYTFRLRAPLTGDAWEWFARLAAAQQAPYAAFVDIGDWAICSVHRNCSSSGRVKDCSPGR